MLKNNLSLILKKIILPKVKVFYVISQGNAGDNLITVSAISFLNKIGIEYQTLLVSEVYSLPSEDILQSCFLIGGGGGLIPNYDTITNLLDFLTYARQVIQLPSTADNIDEFLENYKCNFSIFLREKQSFDYIKSLNLNFDSYLAQDLVFYANIDSWHIEKNFFCITREAFNSYKRKGICRSAYLKAKLYLLAFKFLKTFNISREISLFRTDSESSGKHSNEKSNIDISNLFNYGQSSIELIYESANDFVSFINLLNNNVKTDRLHVAIASAKLGKQVEFYGGNYHKCKSVYDWSIKGKFKNVIWKDKVD